MGWSKFPLYYLMKCRILSGLKISTNNIINVELKQNNSMIQLIVEDNGIGIPKDLDITKANSLGLYMVDLLVKDIGGEMKFIPINGTRIEIEFPIP